MAYYLEVTIDSTYIDSTLSNFPIGIIIDSSDTILSGLGSTDYEGFHFTVDDVECYAEIAYWNMTEELAIVYVLIPSIDSSTDTILKIQDVGDDNTSYVGVIGSTPGKAVWDSNFVGVYHMTQDPSGGSLSFLDSTQYENHGTPHGTMTSGNLVDGGFGKTIEFDSNDYIEIPDDDILDLTTAFTLESFVNPDDVNNWQIIIHKGYGYPSVRYELAHYSGSPSKFTTILNTGAWQETYINFTEDDNFHYFTGVFNKVNVVSRVDYSNTASKSNTGTISADTTTLLIGTGYGASQFFNGSISEIRISKFARSDAWLKAVYYNLTEALYSKSYEEEIVPITSDIFGQISISGKNVDILQIQIVDKGKWRIVNNVYMLIDKDWRLNIIS